MRIEKRPPVLSDRLRTIADMVSPDLSVADIGCDHGFVAIHLALTGNHPRVIAMDVKKGPLERAREHIAEYHLEDRIEMRLSDGLEQLSPGEVNGAIIAGMGARLMIHILSQGSLVAHQMSEIVAEPQSEVHLFRQFLQKEGYVISRENMVEEDGKFYPIIVFSATSGSSDPHTEEASEYLWYGKQLLLTKHPVLYRYLLREQSNVNALICRLEETGNSQKKRMTELKERLKLIQKALQYYDK